VVAGGSPGHDCSREVGEQREEVEGDSFMSSPRAEVACGGTTGGDELQADAALVAAVESSGEGGKVNWEVRGGAESGVGLFIDAGRRYLGRGEHAELVLPASIAVRPAGVKALPATGRERQRCCGRDSSGSRRRRCREVAGGLRQC
jgi:hypothetical protein